VGKEPAAGQVAWLQIRDQIGLVVDSISERIKDDQNDERSGVF